MKAEILSNIRRLLSTPVLLPISTGRKKPSVQGWQNLTPETCDQSHEAQLLAADAVGVALGSHSGGLVSVDMDSDEAAAELMGLNPWMTGTLTTKGQRGCNFWFRMLGPYPERSTSILTAEGTPVGEFRSGGGQTVIAGRHPSGSDYRYLVEAPPLCIPVGGIRWPDHWRMGGRESASEFCLRCARAGFVAPATPRKALGANFGEGLGPSSEWRQAEGEAEKTAEVDADSSTSTAVGRNSVRTVTKIRSESREMQMAKLYRRFLGDVLPAPHQRNATVVHSGTFLYHAVGEEVAVSLLMRFYDENATLWNDSREQHEAEVRAHLRNVGTRFEAQLSAELKLSYLSLATPAQRAAARISLALDSRAAASGLSTFFLSYDDAAARLGLSTNGAFEVMKVLMERGLVAVVEPGRKRAAGQRPLATSWRWTGPK